MKIDVPSAVCYTLAFLLVAFVGYREVSTVGDIAKSSVALLVFAMVLVIIPLAKRFTLFKVFEFERHDDK